MTTAFKMIVLILSLGIDTLMMSTTLGFIKPKGTLKIALAFASAEALMPLIGFLIGRSTSQFIGHWSSLVGGVALIAVAIWFIFFENEEEEKEKLERSLVGWTLIFTALSISLDELAIGFSIGFIGVPIVLTIILIAAQAFAFTFLGLTFGSQLKPFLGEWSEKLAGIILALLGIWILIETFTSG